MPITTFLQACNHVVQASERLFHPSVAAALKPINEKKAPHMSVSYVRKAKIHGLRNPVKQPVLSLAGTNRHGQAQVGGGSPDAGNSNLGIRL